MLTPDSAVHTLVDQAVRTSLRVLDEVTDVRRSVERLPLPGSYTVSEITPSPDSRRNHSST
ncbi:hypothetical protein [Streptomyces sp. CB02460]|uniref:hypothetical protein n=1 Tax=Streptomyces sp. CB02460 TaxID=1703941 RepID=UPI00093A5AD7|nr:hypothetical protein [Streptomyces sp. CB02460]OKJ70019.1 hypothetical protein AMK30_27920 [Streptomyces sp. CB02460]